jgi:hypothetical protein
MQERRVLQVKVESIAAQPEQEGLEQPSLFQNEKQ